MTGGMRSIHKSDTRCPKSYKVGKLDKVTGLNVNLFRSSLFTLVTVILSSFMYLLYVTCKISFKISSIFTLWTKKSLKTILVYTYCLKFPKRKQTKGYYISNFIKIQKIL